MRHLATQNNLTADVGLGSNCDIDAGCDGSSDPKADQGVARSNTAVLGRAPPSGRRQRCRGRKASRMKRKTASDGIRGLADV
jgi:hypothetical protein